MGVSKKKEKTMENAHYYVIAIIGTVAFLIIVIKLIFTKPRKKN